MATRALARLTAQPLFWVGALLAAIIVLTLVLSVSNIWRWSINPREPYQTYTPPPAPDYSDPASWALWPADPPPGAWVKSERTLWGTDVFFVHPTTDWSGDQWNAPIDAPEPAARLEADVLQTWAGPFERIGPVYAPRYRQATLFAFLTHREDARAAKQTAFRDVAAAFDEYVATRNQGRALVLVGVGQGGLHLQRLIETRVVGTDLETRVSAVYLLETATPMSLFEGRFGALRLCDRPGATLCMVAFQTARSGDASRQRELRERSEYWLADGALSDTKEQALACVNPLLGAASQDFAPARLHKGGAAARGLEFGAGDPAILPNETSALCVDGVLLTDNPRSSELRDRGFAAWVRPHGHNLVYADLAADALARSLAHQAWLDENAPRPASPMPRAEEVDIAPVRLPGETDAEYEARTGGDDGVVDF